MKTVYVNRKIVQSLIDEALSGAPALPGRNVPFALKSTTADDDEPTRITSKKGDEDASKPIAADDNVDKEAPVEPDNKAKTQVSYDDPPTEDDDFVPKSPDELSRAAKKLTQAVDKKDVQKVYRDIKRIANDAKEIKMESKKMSYKSLRSEIRKMLREADRDDDIQGMMDDLAVDAPDEFEFSPEELAAAREEDRKRAEAEFKEKDWGENQFGKKRSQTVKLPEKEQRKTGWTLDTVEAALDAGEFDTYEDYTKAMRDATAREEEKFKHQPGMGLIRGKKYQWDDIQAEIGASTPTTAKQMIGDPKRGLDRMGWMMQMQQTDPAELTNKLKDAVDMYLDTMQDAGEMDDEMVTMLKDNPALVIDSDEFRDWNWSKKGLFRKAFESDIQAGKFKPKKHEDF